MSYPSRPSVHPCALGVAALISALCLPVSVSAQVVDRWQTTADRFDMAQVESHLDAMRAQLAARHGPLAEALFAIHEGLMATPHGIEPRPAVPAIPRMRHRVEAAHLIHYQAMTGGSLGGLHGSLDHPIGLAWFPHSMFAQSGRVFGQWGHARLLGAVQAHVERHAD